MTQIKVGAFVAAGLIVLLVSIFMIGSNRSVFQEVVEVHSYFESAQGLNKGAVVSLAGVKVGNIDKITFDDVKNLVKVTCNVDKDHIAKLKTDSTVEIRTQGALGDKYLYIIPGTPGGVSLKSGDELKSATGEDLLSVFSKRGSETEKIFDILDDLKKITHSLAETNNLPKITSNLAKSTENLEQITTHLNKTIKSGNPERSLSKIENIVTKIDRGEGTLGALINDNSLHERLKNILGAGQKNQQVKNILKSSVQE